jgi:hypothetical protein
MKNFLKEIEERERKNREYKEAQKKQKEERIRRSETMKAKRAEKDREKELKEKEMKIKKEKEKERLAEEAEKKKKVEKQMQLERLENDFKNRERRYTEFRKRNTITSMSLSENIKDKINNWNDLAKKEMEVRKNRKKEILKNQYELRNKKEANPSSEFNTVKIQDMQKQKTTIEEMCILGDINKKEIILEKESNPEKFIPIEKAVKIEDKKDGLFVLGLLAKNLEKSGITTVIEDEEKKKEEEKNEEKEIDESATSLQFLINGLATKKKFNLHFDINEQRNEELLNNKEEQTKFINNLRTKLSKQYNIPEDDIIITNPQRGSFQVSVIFKTEDFNLQLDDFKEKFKDDKELIQLKEIEKDLLFAGCKINKNMLDSRGNNCDGGWGKNEKRGGEPYIPPEGWIGYGLKVLDMYDHEKEGPNDWLSYDNRPGEWCVAYHGVGNDCSSEMVAKAVHLIAKDTLREKSKQNQNSNSINDDEEYDYSEDADVRHPGNLVGKGVYCSPIPEVMEEFAGTVEIDNAKYKMGFMLRVNPDKIRAPQGRQDFWVLNGNPDEVRPYRILIKKVEE